MVYKYSCFVYSNLNSIKFQWNLSLSELKYHLIPKRECFRKIFERNIIKSISRV